MYNEATSMAEKDLIFTVKREDTAGTAERLRSAGVSVSDELHNIGIISGSADDAELDNLRKIPGVLGIGPSRSIQIKPPDSPIQ